MRFLIRQQLVDAICKSGASSCTPLSILDTFLLLVIIIVFFFVAIKYKKHTNAVTSEKIYKNVVKNINKYKQISPALIQRKYKVNYDIAKGVIDKLESRGLISEPNGAKPRRIIK